MADAELRALLGRLKKQSGLSYEALAEEAPFSRGAAQNYITKPGHRRDRRILASLLAALGSSADERDEALRLLKLTSPADDQRAAAGWEERARAAECTAWEMAAFTPAEATVHTAIGRRQIPVQEYLATPPAYVWRSHDRQLRADVAAAATGDLKALILLRGSSSTGKTRSLFEAVQSLCPGWAVIRPRSAATLRSLGGSGLLTQRPCVVWLNELQDFLRINGSGLSIDVLRDLLTADRQPVVVVGTLWPEKLHAATAEDDDLLSDNRALLTRANQWVRSHNVAPRLDESERAAARALASHDHRLEDALADRHGMGFAQTLAGAYELLEHYSNTTTLTDRFLLDAAADARRLGHTHALPASLLESMTLARWRDERDLTTPPPDWFEHALAYATTPLRSTDGVQALIQIDATDVDDPRGAYDLADYLEQRLRGTRAARAITDRTWTALLDGLRHPDDFIAMAEAANVRGRFGYTETFR